MHKIPFKGNTLHCTATPDRREHFDENKVEICGVDTAKLPVLKMKRCVNYFVKCKVEISAREN